MKKPERSEKLNRIQNAQVSDTTTVDERINRR